MKVKITVTSIIIGGMSFDLDQELSSDRYSKDMLGHLLEIDAAVSLDRETKVVEAPKPAKKPQSTPSSPQAKASPKRTRKPRTKKQPA